MGGANEPSHSENGAEEVTERFIDGGGGQLP